ncbi:hypothetical protein vseg_010263 [Gypsophila vaccaria]
MQSDVPLDYAVFQLSPRRSRCELFVSYDGATEKLASGLVKPFVTHLKVAEEQVALAGKSIKLDVDGYNNAETWFTKGTLERFVRFVSTPEVLEMVNTFDAEMSQLEAARKIYSQGASDHESSTSGGLGNGLTAASDATKKELLRAIDVRLSEVKQGLTTACSRAYTAGFNPQSVTELQFFADRFGAVRLSEACSKFITLTQQRPDLFNSENNTASAWKPSSDNVLRSSVGSDMSLDDPSDDQLRSSRCATTKATLPSRRFSREPSPSPSPIDDLDERENINDKDLDKDKDKDKDKDMGTTTSATTSTSESASTSTGKPQLTRRLSVQERISLFENKAQSSPSTATTPTSTGGKPEFRRLSTDINSSTDKAVLRRWSGASDMSIDVSGDRKESDSNVNTPTASSAPLLCPVTKSKISSDVTSEEGGKDSKLPARAKFVPHSIVSSESGSGVKEPLLSESNTKIPSFTEKSSTKDQSSGGELRSKDVESGSSRQSCTDENLEGFSGKEGKSQGEVTNVSEISVSKAEDRFDDNLRDQQAPEKHRSRIQSRRSEGDLNSATSEVHVQPVIQSRVEAHPGLAPPRWQSSSEVEKAEAKNSESPQHQTESHSKRREISVGGKSQGFSSGSDQVPRFGGRKESGSKAGGSQMGLDGKSMAVNMEAFSSASSVHVEQVQKARQPKGNQGVNDELKMKANELEKLFAEHKLRVPGDQSNSARRIRPAEMAKEVREPVKWKQEKETSPDPISTAKLEDEPDKDSSEMDKFISTPSSKTFDIHDYDVTPKPNVYTRSFSDDSRGKLYQKYMQKRDVKLREDWSSNRPEKEAQMKAMHDSLEKSRAEMKVKLAASAEKNNSAFDSRQRADKLRSFSVQSAMKRDQSADLFISDEDEAGAEFLGKKLTETYLGDSSSKSSLNKRVQPNKSSSPSGRNPTGPIPRSSGKASNSATGRRRLPYDNPLAQSVPNFSDLKKENTRPLPGGSKPARPQARIHARKKSVSDDLLLVNEEKPRRSQLLKKNTVTTTDLNSSRNSDDLDDAQFMPSKYHREENEDYEKISNEMESKTIPRKGNGIGRVDGSSMGICDTSVTGEAAINGHSFGDASFGTEEMDVAKDEDDYETTAVEKSGISVYENSNALRYVSQAGSISTADLPMAMPSLFRSMGSTLDSPGESPGSWNSRVQNAFSFSHEISDVDASDSPTGSPASWNFHTLSHSEAEAARMRKKWGAAQKPIAGIDSSHSPSRKDVTRGLKRFLKFGRKNRASENVADWISATTSEGDDSEDGRDLANRSSEDLRKSRMGFSQSHNSDEGFNGSDLFNDQVHALRSSIPTPPSSFKLREEHLSGSSLKAPKSFFSLSNFRSKGNDSKPR